MMVSCFLLIKIVNLYIYNHELRHFFTAGVCRRCQKMKWGFSKQINSSIVYRMKVLQKKLILFVSTYGLSRICTIMLEHEPIWMTHLNEQTINKNKHRKTSCTTTLERKNGLQIQLMSHQYSILLDKHHALINIYLKVESKVQFLASFLKSIFLAI